MAAFMTVMAIVSGSGRGPQASIRLRRDPAPAGRSA